MISWEREIRDATEVSGSQIKELIVVGCTMGAEKVSITLKSPVGGC